MMLLFFTVYAVKQFRAVENVLNGTQHVFTKVIVERRVGELERDRKKWEYPNNKITRKHRKKWLI
jgi:hypothetical protein